MKKVKKLSETQLIVGPFTCSYPHVFEKHALEGQAEGKYSCGILIPKDEKETLDAIKAACKAAVDKKWGSKPPKSLRSPLKDGDEMGEEAKGCWYIQGSSKRRPAAVNRDLTPIEDEESVYGGCNVWLALGFYAYDMAGNKGVSAGLDCVRLHSDGERFGGGAFKAADAFAGVDDDEQAAKAPSADGDDLFA